MILKSLLCKISNKIKEMNKIRFILIIVFSLIFIASTTYLITYKVNAYSNNQKMRKLAPVNLKPKPVQNHTNKTENVSQKPSILPQFQKLYNQNPDIIGWVSIDNTNINYPVMFTPNDEEYYLHRNFQKEQEDRGLPFLDGGTDINKSSNYIIYGHNMKDGTGFADLNKYYSKSFFENHSIIHFNTIYGTGDYKIIAVFLSKIYNENENVFKYYKFNFEATNEQYNDFVKNVKKISLYDTGIDALPGEQLLTLSTCSYHTENGRLAVVAKKIK